MRARTLLERMGFKDPDLTTPEHDKIFERLITNPRLIARIISFTSDFLSYYPIETIARELSIVGERPVGTPKGNRIIGFVDIHVFCAGISFLIEIKPTIRSLGEVLRQMRTYLHYMPRAKPILVVRNHNGFKRALEAQGIFVYEWSEDDEAVKA